jgi:hypothetical protein
MKNWKTTLAGLILAAPAILTTAGIAIPAAFADIIQAVGAALVGYFAKDKNVSGV